MSATDGAGVVAIGDRPIAFVARGDRGPPVAFLHGFGADRMSWAQQQVALAALAATVAVDLPAHGESGNDVGEGTIASLSEIVAGFLQAHSAGPAHLVGHSLGGAIAIDLAHRYPGLVASLFLVAPAGLGRAIDPRFLADFMSMTTLDETEGVLERLVARPRLINRQMAARALDRLLRPGTRDGLQKIAAALATAAETLQPAIAAIGRSGLPRMVAWGEADRINPIDQPRVGDFGGDLSLMPGAGHLPQVENPSAVNAMLRRFYSAIASITSLGRR
jgi:pyruvate dehydrogenase E2 component (dihydrolipoamide acetyltransferase)